MPTVAEHLKNQPFELILSSGFFGFYAHTGFVAALEELDLRPAAVGGSSAGALVGGLWAAGVSVEALRERLFTLTREAFWDRDPSLGLRFYARKAQRLPLVGRVPLLRELLAAAGSDETAPENAHGAGAGLLRGEAFLDLMRELLGRVGVHDFADCRYPVRIVAFDLDRRRSEVLDRGDLALALRAACAFPGLLQPVHIDGTRYLDGGIGDRPGLLAATPGACVLFHHLPTKSPWRRVITAQNGLPSRPGMLALTEPRLPQLSPFHLSRGPEAFALAREMALRELTAPYRGQLG